jgi:hypothetical protein
MSNEQVVKCSQMISPDKGDVGRRKIIVLPIALLETGSAAHADEEDTGAATGENQDDAEEVRR